MLITAWIMGAALAAPPAATPKKPKPVKAGTYPVWVNVDPELFRGQAMIDTVMLDPVGKNRTIARLTWMEGVQPDLTRAEPADLVADPWFLDGSWTIDGDWVATRGEHPVLGPILDAHAAVRIDGMRAPLQVRVIGHELAGGLGLVVGLSDGPADTPIDLEPVIATMDIKAPRVKADGFQTGHVVLDEGYSIDVPPGWRRATPREQSWFGGLPVNGTVQAAFVDPGHVTDWPMYSCAVTTGAATPPAVLDPEKSPTHAKNFRAHARAGIIGGKIATADGTNDVPRFLATSTRRISLPEAEGEVTMLSLGDRDAYRFRTPVKTHDEEWSAVTFYTAWEKSALNCAALIPPGGDALLTTFEGATASIRVTDGDAHPMELSLSERYSRWWPFSHPALQLYWLPIPLAGFALWLAMKD